MQEIIQLTCLITRNEVSTLTVYSARPYDAMLEKVSKFWDDLSVSELEFRYQTTTYNYQRIGTKLKRIL